MKWPWKTLLFFFLNCKPHERVWFKERMMLSIFNNWKVTIKKLVDLAIFDINLFLTNHTQRFINLYHSHRTSYQAVFPFQMQNNPKIQVSPLRLYIHKMLSMFFFLSSLLFSFLWRTSSTLGNRWLRELDLLVWLHSALLIKVTQVWVKGFLTGVGF